MAIGDGPNAIITGAQYLVVLCELYVDLIHKNAYEKTCIRVGMVLSVYSYSIILT